ncbi:MAG: hypothetical protein GY909_16005 [Oligoflexia bacterium]|nr:hypothetical protein [Oligoflexia bacterium]
MNGLLINSICTGKEGEYSVCKFSGQLKGQVITKVLLKKDIDQNREFMAQIGEYKIEEGILISEDIVKLRYN